MTGKIPTGFELPNRTLHCYAEGRNGDWEAICLDLDIAVQGGSFQEVFSSLREAISLYLETVTDLSPQERRALLHRPAPFPMRHRFLTPALRGLFVGSNGDRQRHQFTVPLAASGSHRRNVRLGYARSETQVRFDWLALARSEIRRTCLYGPDILKQQQVYR
jgi:predicted RNase H-like HicB family nuclease